MQNIKVVPLIDNNIVYGFPNLTFSVNLQVNSTDVCSWNYKDTALFFNFYDPEERCIQSDPESNELIFCNLTMEKNSTVTIDSTLILNYPVNNDIYVWIQCLPSGIYSSVPLIKVKSKSLFKFNRRLSISRQETDSFVFFFFTFNLRCEYIYTKDFFLHNSFALRRCPNGPIKSVEYARLQKQTFQQEPSLFQCFSFFLHASFSILLICQSDLCAPSPKFMI